MNAARYCLCGLVLVALCGLAVGADAPAKRPPVKTWKEVVDSIPAAMLPARTGDFTDEQKKQLSAWLRTNYARRSGEFTMTRGPIKPAGGMHFISEEYDYERNGVAFVILMKAGIQDHKAGDLQAIPEGSKCVVKASTVSVSPGAPYPKGDGKIASLVFSLQRADVAPAR